MKKLLLMCVLLSSAAFAADRHVYLNESGGGTQLDDCPNPAHNTKGIAGNTDELTYCTASSPHKFICDAGAGCKSWTITTASCGIAGVAVTNGVTVDVDGDGTEETIYGHPQACVWNMAKSDSCEIHAGTYGGIGTEANEDTAGDGAVDVCDRSDCWRATVTAWGYGPNMGSTGYGTAANPGYLRGAVMNSSTDTWDSNNNKVPDADESVTSYPVVFDGNADGDGNLLETTNCTGNTCSGDAFYAVFVGCGTSDSFCDSSLAGGQTRPRIDTDANGSTDSDAASGGAKNVSYFYIKDIEAKNYNGGATTCSAAGVREGLGHFTLAGGPEVSGSGDGLTVDHIYWHNGAYSNLCRQEHYVAVFGDNENHSCSVDFTEMKNNYIILDNRFVINDDCDAEQSGADECGCSKSFHDNRVVIHNTIAAQYQGLIRLKSLDTVDAGARAKKFWLYNNEIIWQRPDTTLSYIIFPECFGKCDPFALSLGTISFHGNLIRLNGASDPKYKRFSQISCTATLTGGPGGINWKFYSYNNTFDIERIGGGTSSFDAICSTTGTKYVSKNNAVFGVTASQFNLESATTLDRTNNLCTTSNTGCTTNTSGRTAWWTVGTQNVGVTVGLDNYIAKASGPLDNSGACDPDGDGALGADVDGDGDQDLTWTDLSGRPIDCSTVSSSIDIGAVQNTPIVGAFCGDGIINGSETCEGTGTCDEVTVLCGGLTCITQGFASGDLLCNGSCALSTASCIPASNPITHQTQGITQSGVTDH